MCLLKAKGNKRDDGHINTSSQSLGFDIEGTTTSSTTEKKIHWLSKLSDGPNLLAPPHRKNFH